MIKILLEQAGKQCLLTSCLKQLNIVFWAKSFLLPNLASFCYRDGVLEALGKFEVEKCIENLQDLVLNGLFLEPWQQHESIQS